MKKNEKVDTIDREVKITTTIEMIEPDKISYVKEMQEYLSNLKKMSQSESKKISRENLIKSEIIEESGRYSKRYKESRAQENKG